MMKRPPYFGRSLRSLLIFLPLLFQLFFFVSAVLAELLEQAPAPRTMFFVGVGIVFTLICAGKGRKAVKDASPATPPIQDRFIHRYLPVVLAFGYTLAIAGIALLRAPATTGAVFHPFLSVFVLPHITSSAVISLANLFSAPSPWLYLAAPLTIYLAYTAGMARGFQELKAPRVPVAGSTAAAILLLGIIGLLVWRIEAIGAAVFRGSGEALGEKVATEDYQPFAPDNKLVKISEPTLRVGSDHPRLDGATAAFPVYAAAAEAIYQNLPREAIRGTIDASTTPRAYERLISGKADLIFTAQPSPEQRAAVAAAGLPLDLTPIGKEAFVFFVHKDNPVKGLSSSQIRAIYSRKIRRWSELGGTDDAILPLQRPAGSGSQTALELKVMKGVKPSPALREEQATGMGGIIQQAAAYRNSREAIGYSFRFFATTMNPNKDIRLLEIDGVAPTRESIRSGAYPYTVDVFAVTAGTANPHVQDLIEWFLGPQGRKLIEDTGYVAAGP